LCRGYEDKFGIVRETLRSEMIARLTRYGSEFFQLREQMAAEPEGKESGAKEPNAKV
jgi:hypothetical protein